MLTDKDLLEPHYNTRLNYSTDKMNAIVSAFVLAVAITVVWTAATTRHPHHHMGISAGVLFYFDQPSGNFIMKKDGRCYFISLTEDEKQAVHNPDGLRQLEVKALSLHTTNAHLPMTGLDHAHVSHYVYNHLCHNETMIRLAL